MKITGDLLTRGAHKSQHLPTKSQSLGWAVYLLCLLVCLLKFPEYLAIGPELSKLPHTVSPVPGNRSWGKQGELTLPSSQSWRTDSDKLVWSPEAGDGRARALNRTLGPRAACPGLGGVSVLSQLLTGSPPVSLFSSLDSSFPVYESNKSALPGPKIFLPNTRSL